MAMDKKMEDILQEHYEMLKTIEGHTLELEERLNDLRYNTSDGDDFAVRWYLSKVEGTLKKLKREIERARARNDEISLLVRSGKL